MILWLSDHPLLAGHPRDGKTYDTMRLSYYWPDMANEVYDLVRR